MGFSCVGFPSDMFQDKVEPSGADKTSCLSKNRRRWIGWIEVHVSHKSWQSLFQIDTWPSNVDAA